jgi:hypothetical protein
MPYTPRGRHWDEFGEGPVVLGRSARLNVCGTRLGAFFGTARPGRRGPSPATSGGAHTCVPGLLGSRPGATR